MEWFFFLSVLLTACGSSGGGGGGGNPPAGPAGAQDIADAVLEFLEVMGDFGDVAGGIFIASDNSDNNAANSNNAFNLVDFTKIQLDWHSPFYINSDLKEINNWSAQIAVGGSILLPYNTLLDLAVVEDIIVNTAPDVVFHLGLRKQF